MFKGSLSDLLGRTIESVKFLGLAPDEGAQLLIVLDDNEYLWFRSTYDDGDSWILREEDDLSDYELRRLGWISAEECAEREAERRAKDRAWMRERDLETLAKLKARYEREEGEG